MVTLSSPRVGNYVGQHFVAAYQQKGDFLVTRVGGDVQKNGGNVVSYFCTPELHVVHFVVGPVEPERFLAEARFAREAHQAAFDARAAAKRVSPANQRMAAALLAGQRRAIAAEHFRQAGEPGEALRVLGQLRRADPARSKRRSSRGYGAQAVGGRWQTLLWNTAFSGGNDQGQRVHRLLAYAPLPRLAEIDGAVFQALAGERVNDQDGSVGRAVVQVEAAAKAGRPLMFVFYNNWHAWRHSRRRAVLAAGERAKLIARFEVVNLPARELPALSAQLDGFALPEARRGMATIVLADCGRNRLATATDDVAPEAFEAMLRDALEANGLIRAARLVEQKQRLAALRLLTPASKSKRPEIAARARELLAALD